MYVAIIQLYVPEGRVTTLELATTRVVCILRARMHIIMHITSSYTS